jgi:hypothetical protein
VNEFFACLVKPLDNLKKDHVVFGHPSFPLWIMAHFLSPRLSTKKGPS